MSDRMIPINEQMNVGECVYAPVIIGGPPERPGPRVALNINELPSAAGVEESDLGLRLTISIITDEGCYMAFMGRQELRWFVTRGAELSARLNEIEAQAASRLAGARRDGGPAQESGEA